MLVTGLPKWDLTVRLRTEPIELPKSWWNVVAGRKVFLWNSFYDFDGSSIPYFESIYQWFQKHLDCALIWRAHPMTDTVTKLYYPSSYYDRLQKYISLTDMAPNMIFDQEESYASACICSDAQISDLSSMMYQYMLLDKPVLYIKTSGRGKIGAETIIDNSWMDQAENAGDILRFLDEIRNGTDRNKALRESICQRDLPLADGQCGKRVGEMIWDLMHQEDQLPT